MFCIQGGIKVVVAAKGCASIRRRFFMGESKRNHRFLLCPVLQWNGDYFIGRIDVKIGEFCYLW